MARLLGDDHFLAQHLLLFGGIEAALARASTDREVRDRHAKEALQLVIRRCRSRDIWRLPEEPASPTSRLAVAVVDSLSGALPPAELIIACCLYIIQSLEFHAEGLLEGRLYLEFVQQFFSC